MAKRLPAESMDETIAFKKNDETPWNLNYLTINGHKGGEQSRKDDIESLGYMLINFVKGSLPWQKIKNKKTLNNEICEMKSKTSVESLCKGLPVEFTNYLYYCQAIKVSDKPSYNQLNRLFTKLFKSKGLDKNPEYDWNKLVCDARNLPCARLILNDTESNCSHDPDKKKDQSRIISRSNTSKFLRSKNSIEMDLKAIPENKEEKPIKQKSKIKNLQTIAPRTKYKLNSKDKAKELDELCNFKIEDIMENSNLLSIYSKFLDDSIPDEKIIPARILIPSCDYIRNPKRILENRDKKKRKIFLFKTIAPSKHQTKIPAKYRAKKSWVALPKKASNQEL